MVCVQCGGQTQVINSRHQKRANQVWRRRRCHQCNAIFTSEETASYSGAWRVAGDAGITKGTKSVLEPFSRDKLFLSLHRSLQHRKTALSDAQALSDTVIKKLSGSARAGLIEKKAIICAAQVALNRIDTAASVHYAAVHDASA